MLKTPPESPKVVPAWNGGVLRVGNPGNKGGGRPRDEVRQVMLDGLEKALPRLLKLSESTEPAIALKATEMLAKYGLGTSNELDTKVDDKRVLSREERAKRALTLLKTPKTA